jgi:hypothetical protein
MYKSSINPITNPNHVYNHSYTWPYIPDEGCESSGDENGTHDDEGNVDGDVGFSKVNVELLDLFLLQLSVKSNIANTPCVSTRERMQMLVLGRFRSQQTTMI